MPGNLTEMEIHILYILYRNKNFRSDAGYHSKKLKKILQKKYNRDFDIDSSRETRRGEKKNASAFFDRAITNLKNSGYIATIKKDDPKYYISDLGKTYSVLEDHGLNVTPLGGGRVHHLD